MFRKGVLLFSLVWLIACNNDKTEEEETEGFSYEQFSKKIANAPLPYQVTDTGLLKNKDTASIRSAAFAAFIPDSLRTKIFGKNAKVKYISQSGFKISDNTSFYVIKAVSGSKKALLLLAFDKSQYSAVFPLLVPDADPATSQWSVIDKSLAITKNISKRESGGTTIEGKDVYHYDAASKQFSLVLTNPLDDRAGEIINPIDTFSRKHRFAGDYTKDKKNFVSVRDGRYPNQLMLFMHLDKNNGECNGELKGELILTSTTTAVYRQSGDPCIMSFKFSGNTVVVKEDQGCGAHRGLDCSFDGTFTRKKETRPKPAKKRSGSS